MLCFLSLFSWGHAAYSEHAIAYGVSLLLSRTCMVSVGNLDESKGLFTWSGGPRSSGVGFFCFHALGDTKQKKLTPLDRGPPIHVNRV